jgi:hypothetical protein
VRDGLHGILDYGLAGQRMRGALRDWNLL